MAGKIAVFDAVKIQARALIPVVKALENEIGKDRAHALVRDAIAESYAQFVSTRTPSKNTHPGDDRDSAQQFPTESEVVEHTNTTYGYNITRCQFAEYFRKIGEPEIGALLTCGVDFAVEARLRPNWEFQRTQTQMEGAPFCDFRWRLRGANSDAGNRS